MSRIWNKSEMFINKKGSFTVEASIIFSVVFLLVAALVYIFVLMYKYAFLQSAANKASNIGGYYYSEQYGIGGSIRQTSDLYWRMLDTKTLHKKEQLNRYISNSLEKSIVDLDIYSDNLLSHKFFSKQINIRIETQYPLPIGNMFEKLGLPSTLKMRAEANSNIYDNAEFVRNLDIITDIKKCILNSDNKWIGKGSKVSDVLEKLLKH
ncbi:pilus assembly protein [Ruminiclostridium herbifermentans]|uniref:Pilus assembly protein n=1 Tax=Ruminiclostridium herbifermentans TaxID=2488810 RepID=A0A4U7JE11_9FIRM|nr:TadE family protein [Ruminiclostridium herbifermentans]QNU65689.1 pilus assembly protein [Ruminiclostridium herbifermentans]